VKVDFFIVEHRPDSDGVTFGLLFRGQETVSELANDLIVLFLYWIRDLVDEEEILFALEVFLFVFEDLSLEFWGLAEIWKFLEEYLHKLNLGWLLFFDFFFLFFR
jgi:hypothetical protein